MNTTSGEGNAYPPENLSSPSIFNGVRVALSFMCSVLYRVVFLNCTFYLGQYGVSPPSIYGLITPLVSSNFPYTFRTFLSAVHSVFYKISL